MRRFRHTFRLARASLLWELLRLQKRTVKWLFVVLAFQTVGVLQVANLTREMVDSGIVDQTAPLWDYVPLIAFWAVWTAAFSFTQQQLAEKLSYRVEFDLRTQLYTHVQSAELRRLDQVATGQLVTRSLTDIQVIDYLFKIFPVVVGLAPLILGIPIVVAIINPLMGVMAVLAVPINLWLISKFRTRLRALSWAELNERAEVTTAIDEPVRGIRVVKAFGREAQERERVRDATERAFQYAMNRTRLVAGYDFFLRMTPLLIQAGLMALGVYLLSTGRLTVGTFLLAFQMGQYLNQFSSALGEIASSWQYLRSAQDRLAEMFALDTRHATAGSAVPPPSSGLDLHGLTMTLGSRRLLHELELHVRPGELVVVSGPPGCGKTTLAAIAAGLVEPDGGEALLDGVAIGDLDPTQLRQTIRVASEEPLLLAATLRDNLLLGASGDVDDATLIDAMRVAGAEDVVDQLGGLDGAVGDRGLTVSGGQRQRISLARALVAHPRVLILDDALSAVNPALEVVIMRRVRERLPDSAILYITRRHGLATIADRSVRLEASTEVDEGLPGAPRHGFDPSTEEAIALEAVESVVTGDVVGGLEAVDLLGSDASRADAAVRDEHGQLITPADVSDLEAMDPGLAELVRQLQVTREHLHVPDEVASDDTRPRYVKIARLFGGTAIVAFVLVFLEALGTIAPSLVFGRITNIVEDSNGQGAGAAYVWAGVMVGIAVAVGFFAKYWRIFAQRFNQSTIVVLRRRVFNRLTKLGVNYYDRELPGDVATRIVADLDRILTFVQEQGFRLVASSTIFVTCLGAIVIIAPGVFPVVLAVVAIMVVLTILQQPFASRALARSRQALGVVTRKFQEDFGARHEIRNLGAQAIQAQKFTDASVRRRRARFRAVTWQNSHNTVIQFLGTMMTALVLYRAGTLVLDQELSIGAAVSVQLLAATAAIPLLLIAPYYNQLLDVRVSWRRLCEPFDEPILPVSAPNPQPCPRLDGVVSFDGARFTYPDTTRRVLHDVSFAMRPGRVTALVGYTGAGKSSIAKLLGRTYDPDEGRVLVNGIDLRRLDLDAYRPRLGVVPQDPFMFRGTVATNIRYAKPDATDEEVAAAVRAVGAWELLSALPDGLQHKVEEEGHNLTAAQRQLVALIRAWLARPDVLVLDEATSLLDADVEDSVLHAVRRLACTTLMITHRETVAAQSDYIVVLDAGRVVDAGTLDDVARPGGSYDRLWRVQEDELAEERDRLLAT